MTDDPITTEPSKDHVLTTRQEDRMAALPAVYKTAYERMACELALGMDEPEDIFAHYGYNNEQAQTLLMDPEFVRTVDRVSQEVRATGLSFKTKVKMQAEALLPHAFLIASDELQPTSERVKLIIWHGKMAGHEPAITDEKNKGSGGGLNLSITFSGQAPMKVVSSESNLIEQS